MEFTETPGPISPVDTWTSDSGLQTLRESVSVILAT